MSDVHHYHGTVWAVVMVCLYRRIWQGVCSPISCHKTESAHELFRTPDCSERSESAAFPHSVRWHIVTDSSLIIPRQWRYTCQSLQIVRRRGWSWIPFAPYNVSARMGSCPTGDLIWTLVGANLTPNYRGYLSSRDPQSPSITRPRKTPIMALIQRTSRDYWLRSLAEHSPARHAVQWPLLARLWQSF